MRIFATRILAPTPGHDTGTKWAVVTDNGPDTERQYFDSVEINGASLVRIAARPDSDPPPHVFVEPSGDASVYGITLQDNEEKVFVILQEEIASPALSDL